MEGRPHAETRNGVAGVAQMFGYPVPKVPEKWRKGAQGMVDLLKDESSVAAFGVVHKKSLSKDKESSETVRGESLRELERFFKDNDPDKKYAGLRRIGDPNDGAAVWTKVDEDDVDAKLAKRAEQRREEGAISRKQGIERLSGERLGPAAS